MVTRIDRMRNRIIGKKLLVTIPGCDDALLTIFDVKKIDHKNKNFKLLDGDFIIYAKDENENIMKFEYTEIYNYIISAYEWYDDETWSTDNSIKAKIIENK